MTSIINIHSFETTESKEYFDLGTVEVTLRGTTKRVDAMRDREGPITAFGMTGRYQTGTKAWPASVRATLDPTTGEYWDAIHFGRDDRVSKFQKMQGLSFSN